MRDLIINTIEDNEATLTKMGSIPVAAVMLVLAYVLDGLYWAAILNHNVAMLVVVTFVGLIQAVLIAFIAVNWLIKKGIVKA